MKRILLDVHTHTVASGHAYSSLQEMVKAAADKELQVLGITEHGPSIPGTCPLVYFRNMFVVPRQMYGIRLLMGCEVNILDTNGSLDLNDEYLDRLDIAIAGIHGNCWKGGDKNQNTEGMLTVINNPKIHVISHPGDGTAEMDFEQLVFASKEAHTQLEINNHSLAPQRKKMIAITNSLEKAVFTNYRSLCKASRATPILIFNEADAILGTRMGQASQAVDKMENTIQNIILQEMETLDGIMIATTNLEQSLDSAFERRFIYKVRFDRPGIEQRQKIWLSMLPTLSEDMALQLATSYDFSGGQIENIVRKCDVESILYGESSVDADKIQRFCQEETILKNSTSRIGFV